MFGVDKVELDEQFPGLIVVTDINGATLRYYMRNGMLYPGRPYIAMAPDGHRVMLFLPFGESGPPEILSVDEPTLVIG